MKNVIKSAREALALYESYDKTLAELSAEKDRIASAMVLNRETCRKFADVNGGLALAAHVEKCIDKKAAEIAQSCIVEMAEGQRRLAGIHTNIANAIYDQISSELPPSLRNHGNVTSCDRYKAEIGARPGSSRLIPPYLPEKDATRKEIKDTLREIIETATLIDAELARTTGVAKGLGIAA